MTLSDQKIEIWTATWDDDGGIGSAPFTSEREAENFLLANASSGPHSRLSYAAWNEEHEEGVVAFLSGHQMNTYNIQPHWMSAKAVSDLLHAVPNTVGTLWLQEEIEKHAASNQHIDLTADNLAGINYWTAVNTAKITEGMNSVFYANAPDTDEIEAHAKVALFAQTRKKVSIRDFEETTGLSFSEGCVHTYNNDYWIHEQENISERLNIEPKPFSFDFFGEAYDFKTLKEAEYELYNLAVAENGDPMKPAESGVRRALRMAIDQLERDEKGIILSSSESRAMVIKNAIRALE